MPSTRIFHQSELRVRIFGEKPCNLDTISDFFEYELGDEQVVIDTIKENEEITALTLLEDLDGKDPALFNLTDEGEDLDEKEETGPYIKVEYDLTYYGGNYSSMGDSAYIPVSLIKLLKSVEKAFTRHTSHNACHIIFYDEDTYYTAEGDEWEEEDVLEEILDVRGTSATNGELQIDRPLDGGYEVRGGIVAVESFWSWNALVIWAEKNNVSLTSGWSEHTQEGNTAQ